MKELIYLILYLITEFINYLLVYTTIFQAKINKNKKICMIAIIIIIILHITILNKFGIYVAEGISCITMIIIPAMLFDGQQKWFYVYPFVVMGTSVIIVSFSFIISTIFNISNNMVVNNEMFVLLCQAFAGLVMFSLYRYRKKRQYTSIHIELNWQQYVLFYIATICSWVMLVTMQELSQGNITDKMINRCGFFISIACIVFIVLILWQGIVVYEKQQYKQQNEAYRKYMKLQNEHFRQIMEQDEKMRRFRHDMNAHMIALKSYSKQENNQELQEYLESILKENTSYEVQVYTGNSGLDAILNQLAEEGKRKQIAMDIKGNLPQELTISIYDLCTILSNLLKNAIEACEKIECISDRQILAEITTYNSRIWISVKNTVEKDVQIKDNQLITSKKDKKNHGIGSRNVADTVKKYAGDVSYQCENGWFEAQITL